MSATPFVVISTQATSTIITVMSADAGNVFFFVLKRNSKVKSRYIQDDQSTLVTQAITYER